MRSSDSLPLPLLDPAVSIGKRVESVDHHAMWEHFNLFSVMWFWFGVLIWLGVPTFFWLGVPIDVFFPFLHLSLMMVWAVNWTLLAINLVKVLKLPAGHTPPWVFILFVLQVAMVMLLVLQEAPPPLTALASTLTALKLSSNASLSPPAPQRSVAPAATHAPPALRHAPLRGRGRSLSPPFLSQVFPPWLGPAAVLDGDERSLNGVWLDL